MRRPLTHTELIMLKASIKRYDTVRLAIEWIARLTGTSESSVQSAYKGRSLKETTINKIVRVL